MDLPLRAALFQLLEDDISPKVDKRNGRPGMALWPIFVCGVVRLDLNIDYDRLHELVNHHNTMSACSHRNSWTKSINWSYVPDMYW